MDPIHLVHSPSIYTGGWINWTEGRLRGSTLTVSSSHGALLIAFLALFIRLAGDHLWNIICFVWFYLRASPEARDALHHQQQSILRSHWGDAFAAWQHMRLGWHWRRVIGYRQAMLRFIPFAVFALVHAALLLIAGLFSGRVAGTVSDVLLNSVSCGEFPFPSWGKLGSTAEDAILFSAISARVQRNLDIASDWSASCYSSSMTNTTWTDCAPLGRSRLRWTTTEIPCPFGDDICTAQAVKFDTGLVDSHLHLGINAPHHDRIAYRRVSECSPIATEGYRQDNIPSADTDIPERFRDDYDPTETFTGFFYGASTELSAPATFYVSARKYPANRVDSNADALPYELGVTAFPSYGNLSSLPIPALRKDNASTTLLLLTNRAKYFAPVNDPWFNATVPSSQPITFPDGTQTENITLYSNPEVASVVSCTESWQWCNQATGQCSPFTAEKPSFSDAEVHALGLNARQFQTLVRVGTAASPTMFSPLVTFLGPESLLAAGSAAFGALPLPDYQWIREIDHWFGTGLTAMQLGILQYVAGDTDAVDYLSKSPPPAEQAWMCTNQIIQRTDYSSFSVLALVLIIVLGSLIMMLSWFLWEFLPKMDAFGRTEKGMQWKFHDALHLQSRVFELGEQWQGEGSVVSVPSSRSAFNVPVSVFRISKSGKSELSRMTSGMSHARSFSDTHSLRNLIDPEHGNASSHYSIHTNDNISIDSRYHDGISRTNSAGTGNYSDSGADGGHIDSLARGLYMYEFGQKSDAANDINHIYTRDRHRYETL